MKQTFVLTSLAVLLITMLSFAIFVPFKTVNGVIDTTLDTCTGLPQVSKSYHILLGQKHDFELVAPHVVQAATPCGQRAEFRLYL